MVYLRKDASAFLQKESSWKLKIWQQKQKFKKLRGKVEAYFRSRSKQTETDHRREKKRRSVQEIK